MKTKIYRVCDLEPNYETEPTQYTVTRLNDFETELEAMIFINNTKVGYGLTILEVWE